jgi:hypothetical protein
MVLLNRLSGGVLLVVFLTSLPAYSNALVYGASSSDTPNSIDFSVTVRYCTTEVGTSCSPDTPSGNTVISSWEGDPYQNGMNEYYRRYESSCVPENSGEPLWGTSLASNTSSGYGDKCYYWHPPAPPECPKSNGDIEYISVNNMSGAGCYEHCMFTGWSDSSWIYGNGVGQGNAVTNGEYCSEDDGQGVPESACNEQGGPNGNQYCDGSDPNYQEPDPSGEDPCNEEGGPNGNNFCGNENANYEEPEGDDSSDETCNENGGSSGTNYCDEGHPDYDGDGDGEPDGPGTGEGDDGGEGEGSGDGGGGGEGTGEEGEEEEADGPISQHGAGSCTPESRTAPTCTHNPDPVQCGIFLTQWNARCDRIQQHAEIIGTEEFREGDSLTDSSNPANTLKTKEVSFSGFLDGLDDSGAGFGGAMTCPPDKQINLGFGSITLPLTYICQWAEKIRPLIVALGWLAAGLIALKAMSEKE